MAFTSDQVLAFLEENGIVARTSQHAPVFTVAESQALRGEIPGVHTKNLFLRDAKRGYFLVVADEARKIDLKRTRKAIGARGSLSFGSPAELQDLLGIQPGAVSLLACINDKGNGVRVVLDQSLLSANLVNCHPLTNERTTSLTPADVLAFLNKISHEPLCVDLAEAGPAAEASEPSANAFRGN